MMDIKNEKPITAPVAYDRPRLTPVDQLVTSTPVSDPVASVVKESAQVTKPQPTEAEIVGAVEKLNKTSRVFNSRIRFEIDNERAKELRVYIVGDDDKVIRAIPPDEVYELSERIKNAIGVLFDSKA